jgi:hypothetical protein
MYLFPIFKKQIHSIDDSVFYQIWVLLERNGTHSAFVESIESALEWAKENDVPLQGEPISSGPFLFLPVDGTSSTLDTFYTWNETSPDEQPLRTVWRPFVWVTDHSGNDIWGTNVQLSQINIAETHSVFDVVTSWLNVECPLREPSSI